MAYKIEVTQSAQSDLNNILGYIVTELSNPSAAAHLLDEVERYYGILGDSPLLYAECTQALLRPSHYRKVVIGGYLLIYRVNAEQQVVYIERFFSNLQDYMQKL